MFFYYTVSKRTLLQWRMASADPPGIIMFVEFFGEKCLLAIAINNGDTRPPAGEAPDKKLKINELGPYTA